MLENTPPADSLKRARMTVLLCAGAGLYACARTFLNVYRFPIGGALYELLWLPMLIATPVLPVVALVQTWKATGDVRRYYLVSLLISLATVILLGVVAFLGQP